MERIAWTRNTGVGRSGWTGAVNGKPLFTIEVSVRRGEGWILRTRLPWNMKPGLSIAGPDVSDGVMKQRAEAVLNAFVTRIGATFLPHAPETGDH